MSNKADWPSAHFRVVKTETREYAEQRHDVSSYNVNSEVEPSTQISHHTYSPSCSPSFTKVLRKFGIAEICLGIILVMLTIATLSCSFAHSTYEKYRVYRDGDRCHETFAWSRVSQGIWCGIAVIITGALAIDLQRKASRNRYLINVAAVLLTVFLLIVGVIVSIMGVVFSNGCFGDLIALLIATAVVCFVLLVITLVHAAYWIRNRVEWSTMSQNMNSSTPTRRFIMIIRKIGIAEICLGIVLFTLALVILISSITHPATKGNTYYFIWSWISQGIWCGIAAIIAGALAIDLRRKSTTKRYMVNVVVASVTAVLLIAGVTLSIVAVALSGEQAVFLVGLHIATAVISFVLLVITAVHIVYCLRTRVTGNANHDDQHRHGYTTDEMSARARTVSNRTEVGADVQVSQPSNSPLATQRYIKVLRKLGLAEISLGVILLILAIVILSYSSGRYFTCEGLWCGIAVITTGGLAIDLRRKSTAKRYMVNVVVASVTAVLLIAGVSLSIIAAMASAGQVAGLHIAVAVILFAVLVITVVHIVYCLCTWVKWNAHYNDQHRHGYTTDEMSARARTVSNRTEVGADVRVSQPSNLPLATQRYRKVLHKLGIAEVCLGIILLILAIVILSTGSYLIWSLISQGLWCGVAVIVTGALAIDLRRKSNEKRYLFNMVAGSVTTVLLVIGLIISIISALLLSGGHLVGLVTLHSVTAVICFVLLVLTVVHVTYCYVIRSSEYESVKTTNESTGTDQTSSGRSFAVNTEREANNTKTARPGKKVFSRLTRSQVWSRDSISQVTEIPREFSIAEICFGIILVMLAIAILICSSSHSVNEISTVYGNRCHGTFIWSWICQGIWCGMAAIVTGALTISLRKQSTTGGCRYQVNKVAVCITVILLVVGIILSIIAIDIYDGCFVDLFALHIVTAVICFVLLVITVVHAAYYCMCTGVHNKRRKIENSSLHHGITDQQTKGSGNMERGRSEVESSRGITGYRIETKSGNIERGESEWESCHETVGTKWQESRNVMTDVEMYRSSVHIVVGPTSFLLAGPAIPSPDLRWSSQPLRNFTKNVHEVGFPQIIMVVFFIILAIIILVLSTVSHFQMGFFMITSAGHYRCRDSFIMSHISLGIWWAIATIIAFSVGIYLKRHTTRHYYVITMVATCITALLLIAGFIVSVMAVVVSTKCFGLCLFGVHITIAVFSGIMLLMLILLLMYCCCFGICLGEKHSVQLESKQEHVRCDYNLETEDAKKGDDL